ncbi:hypothetical protein [Escherichia coli]|uniref:hypothetical protein n=1 Tax=Escherichia coli TaxID=562 RepID=UPI00388FEB3A
MTPVQEEVEQLNQMANEDIVSPTLRDWTPAAAHSKNRLRAMSELGMVRIAEEVKCYCRVMFLTSWSAKQPNVLINCDRIWLGQEE